MLLVLVPFAAFGFSTLTLRSARETAGPPAWTDVPTLPDDVTVLDEQEGCTAGNWVRCYRVRIVGSDQVEPGGALADDLGTWFDEHGWDLYRWRTGWRHPDCSRETGICVAVDPIGTTRARLEISRMSDGL
ncbi:MAG: hypothetical protein KDB36_00675 [Acidimicrobiales bacterium]|nr:hypothetical protein [Acidimicrobiales bacterium]